MKKLKMVKKVKSAAIIGFAAALCTNIQISYATVGLSGITGGNESVSEGENYTPSEDSDEKTDEGYENTDTYSDLENDLTYEPDPYDNSDETTEKNKENMQILSNLMDSWEENPGGSTYTDEGAYYKVGNLTNQPEVNAASAILMDASSGFVLYNRNATEKKYPASMTKVVTAMVALKNGSLNDMITISENAVNNIPSDATKAGFSAGDTVTLKDVLCGLFMASGADAAVAIAEHYGGTEKEFVEKMNYEAQQLGCANTHFVNCHGMHDPDHYTTAYDMALLIQEAISIPEFRDVIGMKSCTIKNENGNKVEKEITLQNKSALLAEGNQNYFEFAKGSKTGHTDAAKYTLCSYAEKDNETLISVVLDEGNFDNCYADHKKLYEWGYSKTQVITPMPSQQDIEGTLKSSLSDDKFEKIKLLSLKYISGYKILTNKAISKDNIRSFFVLDEDMENGILGYLNVSYYDKILIGRTPILYGTDDDGYKEYIKKYDEIVQPEPIVITQEKEDNTETDDTDSSVTEDGQNRDIWADSDETEANLVLDMDASIFDYVKNGYILRISAFLILSIFIYIAVLIQKNKNQ